MSNKHHRTPDSVRLRPSLEDKASFTSEPPLGEATIGEATIGDMTIPGQYSVLSDAPESDLTDPNLGELTDPNLYIGDLDELAGAEGAFGRAQTLQDGPERFDSVSTLLDGNEEGGGWLAEQAVAARMSDLALDLIGVLDLLDGAAKDGAEDVRAGILRALARIGVFPQAAEGQPFSAERFEQVKEVEVAEEERRGVVVEVERAGYAMDSRVLRPARVVVGAPKRG